jgi:hypothetical protein
MMKQTCVVFAGIPLIGYFLGIAFNICAQEEMGEGGRKEKLSHITTFEQEMRVK